MNISKAVITVAGPGQRSLPLQSLVDRDGQQKPALQIILEEAQSAGIDQLCLVVHPGDRQRYEEVLGRPRAEVVFVEQPEPRGYGHAVHCARSFTGDEAFLHFVGDHLYVSRGPERCAQQLVALARTESTAVSAVEPTREGDLPLYGAVGGPRISGREGLYLVEQVLEKPTPTLAEQKLIVPGLRSGRYLCFFGMHVLTPAVMDLLDEEIATSTGAVVTLSGALDRLAGRERYLAAQLSGLRYNIGVRYGLLMAQLALAFAGEDRDEVLAQLLELLIQREQQRP